MKRITPKAQKPTKEKKILLGCSVPPSTIAKLDEECERTGYNRSELVREIIQMYFDEK